MPPGVRILVRRSRKEQDVDVDNQDGTVAARSRALFAQLRSRREGRESDLPTATGAGNASEPGPEAGASAPEAGVYDFAIDQDGSRGSPAGGPGDTPVAEDGPDVTPAAMVARDGAMIVEPGPPAEAVAVGAEVVAIASTDTTTAEVPTPLSGGGPPPGVHPVASTPAVEPTASATDAPAGAPDPPAGAAGSPDAPDVLAEAPHLPGRHPAADLPLPRVVAIANQKGGVGKTTTAVNLGAALAELGFRTLIVDLDPQGNATTGLGVNARNLEHAIYDVLMHELPIDECVEPTSVRNLFVAPATIDLAGAEIELVPAFSRELRLRRALGDVAGDYDFTIIDCPPSLGLLTVNGLAAAGEVIVPIQCEYYALEGLSQLLRNVNLVQSNLNPALDVSAIILTMYDARTKLADQVAAEVRQHFGPKVCRNVVPRTVRLSEAPSFGQPIIVFDPASRGALAYRELAKEVSGGPPQRVG
jgi:chromosome partitioning protein